MEKAFLKAIVVLRKQHNSPGVVITNEPKTPLEIELAERANQIVESLL